MGARLQTSSWMLTRSRSTLLDCTMVSLTTWRGTATMADVLVASAGWGFHQACITQRLLLTAHSLLRQAQTPPSTRDIGCSARMAIVPAMAPFLLKALCS